MSPRVALVTSQAQADLFEDEREILPLLRARGVDARAVVWDDPNADWSAFDAAFIRSPWDYFQKYDAFLAWLSRAEKATRVYNAPALVRWNADKLYLRDLEARGVRIVPTAFVEKGRRVDLGSLLAERGWENAVVKPAISGGAYRTHRVRRDGAAAAQAEVDSILEAASLLVQPFVPEVQTEGEWSFVFFEGTLSHVVVKKPAAGDYRVQPEYGATVTPVTADAGLVTQARGVIDALPVAPQYARIDCVRRGADLLLMEAEVIEPYLYMAGVPGAIERFVAVVERAARRAREFERAP